MYKKVGLLSLGNVLEFYDFAIYSLMVGHISSHFFPSHDPRISLISGFGVFALGFIARPVGALYFGHIGDHKSRMKALTRTLLVSAAATVAIGLLPTYATIGVYAPLLLTLLRLIQGFSLGAEFSGSLVILAETNAQSRFGPCFLSGIVSAAGVGGWVLGSLMSLLFTGPEMPAWGWRVPFLLGGCTAWIAYSLRANYQGYTPPITHGDKLRLRSLFQPNIRPLVFQVAGVGVVVGVVFYGFFIFPNSFLAHNSRIIPATLKQITTGGIVSYMFFLPLMGWLGDRIGAARLMAFSTGISLLYFPMALFQMQEITPLLLGVLMGGSALLLAAFIAPAGYIMTQVFAKSMRFTGTSLSYNLGACCIGGLTPILFATSLKMDSTPWVPLAFTFLTCLWGFNTSLTLFRQRTGRSTAPAYAPVPDKPVEDPAK